MSQPQLNGNGKEVLAALGVPAGEFGGDRIGHCVGDRQAPGRARLAEDFDAVARPTRRNAGIGGREVREAERLGPERRDSHSAAQSSSACSRA